MTSDFASFLFLFVLVIAALFVGGAISLRSRFIVATVILAGAVLFGYAAEWGAKQERAEIKALADGVRINEIAACEQSQQFAANDWAQSSRDNYDPEKVSAKCQTQFPELKVDAEGYIKGPSARPARSSVQAP